MKQVGYLMILGLVIFEFYVYLNPKHPDKHLSCEIVSIQNDTVTKTYFIPYYAELHLYRDMLQYTTESGKYVTIDRNIKHFKIKHITK